MSNPVYSKQVFAVQGCDGPITNLVPEGKLWVVRDCWVYYYAISSGITRFYLIGDNGQTFGYNNFSIALGVQLWYWQGRQVIYNGLGINVSGDKCDVSVMAYELSLP